MDNQIKKNKVKIAVFAILLVFLLFCWVLSDSEINGSLAFQRIVKNTDTGELHSILGSIFLYLLLWWFVGLVPSGVVWLFTTFFYDFLHRKDKRILQSYYHPPYEVEFYFGSAVAFISTYIAALILILLQASNLLMIHIFD